MSKKKDTTSKNTAKAKLPKEEAVQGAVEPKKKPEAKEKEEGLVAIKNLTSYFHIQRSTGLRINPKETKRLLDDGWLKGMVKEKLFELV